MDIVVLNKNHNARYLPKSALWTNLLTQRNLVEEVFIKEVFLRLEAEFYSSGTCYAIVVATSSLH
jgi:hypothetical protein